MKNFNSVLLSGAAVLALLSLTSVAKAQAISSFSSSLISGADTDVLNDGTSILAYGINADANYGASSIGVINGINFTGGQAQNGANLTLGSNTSGNFYNGFTGTGAPASNYNSLLTSEIYTSAATPTDYTLTLSGLTPGATYQFQVFAADFRDGIVARTETLTGIGADTGSATLDFGGGEGSYAIATFTATGVTQGYILNSGTPTGASENIAQFAGVNLIQEASVPEPSTYALLGLGALALLVVKRKRSSLVG